MEKEDNYSAAAPMATTFAELDYSAMTPASSAPIPNNFGSGSSYLMERPFSNFAEALQFADFGPKLALHNAPGDSSHHHQHKSHDDDHDDNYFLDQEINYEQAVQLEFAGASGSLSQMMAMNNIATNTCSSDPVMNCNNNNIGTNKKNSNGKRKRARTTKTNEEAETQRMTHIAVERNRRKQMNEHLRVLRALMPNTYVQRGDQASIVGGAIEFVRELEQLIQCLESQKRRRLYGEDAPLPLSNSQPFDPKNDQIINNDKDVASLMMNMGPESDPAAGLAGLHEESAENKSVIADVEVKLLGFDAFIKILSRRRPGQLIKAISALQDLQFTILHTNITTIEQTALYSFNVKIGSEARFSAEDIAGSVQQIFSFIHANSAI